MRHFSAAVKISLHGFISFMSDRMKIKYVNVDSCFFLVRVDLAPLKLLYLMLFGKLNHTC